MSFSMCLIHVRKRAWYFKSANFEWNKWKNKKILSRIPQMWPLHIFFPRTMCCVWVFLSCTLLDSLNLWMLFIRRFTKRKHCTQKLKYAADTSEREKKNSNIPSDIQLWLFQLQTEIKMFDAKRKCRQRMEWVKREEGKKIVRAPKEQCHYFKCICVFFKSKTVHLPLHIHPLVRKTLHSRRWQKRERDEKKYMTKNARFSSV